MAKEETANTTQEIMEEKTVKGKLVLSFTKPSPTWALWVFRTEFVINKAAMIYLSGTTLVSPDKVKESILILTIADFLTWVVAKSLGIKKQDIENDLTV